MTKLIQILFFFSLILNFSLDISAQKNKSIFQFSSISALSNAYYDGDYKFSDLLKHGNFGIGTFNQLDGEMICIDSKVYKIAHDGQIYIISDTVKTPFSIITSFKVNKTLLSDSEINQKQLELLLDSLMGSKNKIAAIKITGEFKTLKTRSVKKQSKPYKPLIEAVKDQNIFNLENTKGTLVGFYFPENMNGINVPGFHFHYLSEDKKKGGHLINGIYKKIRIEIAFTNNFEMQLPNDENYYQLKTNTVKQSDLHQIEKQQ